MLHKHYFKKIIKEHFKPSSRMMFRRFVAYISLGRDLDNLGIIHKTDKILGHYYTPHYRTHFKKFRNKKINLLEIGVGGYDSPNSGGNSLRMWKQYFPFGKIFSIDIYDKSALEEHRIKIFRGSQVDKIFLEDVVKQTGELDIIIDDGSHANAHIIETFKLLFPKLKDGGIYAIEDIQTSYFPEFGGDSLNLQNPHTAINFFKNLADGLNHREFLIPGYDPTYFDGKITSIHFYHNLIFVYKGNNNEPSTMVTHGRFH